MPRNLLLTRLARALPARGRPDIAPHLLDHAGTALADLIESARQAAIADGVAPVPPAMYRDLLGYFPPALLLKARYGVGRADALALPSLAFSYGDREALTLGEVVLFKSARLALTDAKAWAHALAHAMQYQRWGIAGFAARYVRDSAAIEREATDTADRFAAWSIRKAA